MRIRFTVVLALWCTLVFPIGWDAAAADLPTVDVRASEFPSFDELTCGETPRPEWVSNKSNVEWIRHRHKSSDTRRRVQARIRYSWASGSGGYICAVYTMRRNLAQPDADPQYVVDGAGQPTAQYCNNSGFWRSDIDGPGTFPYKAFVPLLIDFETTYVIVFQPSASGPQLFGQRCDTITLVPPHQPDAPTELEVSEVKIGQLVTVSWDRLDEGTEEAGNGKVYRYEMQYKLAGTEDWITYPEEECAEQGEEETNEEANARCEMTRTNGNRDIPDWYAGEVNVFRVRAWNKASDLYRDMVGPWSAEVSKRLEGAIPLFPPTDLRVEYPAMSETVRFHWRPPEDFDRAGIQEYLVYRVEPDGTETGEGTVISSTSELESALSRAQLVRGAKYGVYVVARRDTFTSPPSPVVTYGSHVAPTVIATGNDVDGTISVQWYPAADSNRGDSKVTWRIQYRKAGIEDWTTASDESDGHRRTHRIYISETATYEVQVMAVNAVGPGVPGIATGVEVFVPNVAMVALQERFPPANNLHVTETSTGKYQLEWDAALGATGYTVAVDFFGASARPLTLEHLPGTATSHEFEKPPVLTDLVRIKHNTCYTYDATTTCTPMTIYINRPNPATNLVARAAQDEVALSWTAPEHSTELGFAGYRITRTTDPNNFIGIDIAVLSDVATTTFSDSTAPYGQELYYTIYATHTEPGTEFNSASSNRATVTLPVTPTVQAPLAPAGLTVTGGTKSFTLSWQAPPASPRAPILDYRIERSDDGTTWETELERTAGTRTEYVKLDGVLSGQTLHFRVTARNAAGLGDASETMSATTQIGAPEPPTELIAVIVNDGVIALDWEPGYDGGAAISAYQVERRLAGASTWDEPVQRQEDGNTQTQFLDRSVTDATTSTYQYRVGGFNSAGPGVRTVPVDAVETLTPANFIITQTGRTLNFDWDPPSETGGLTITHYLLEKSTDLGATWAPPVRMPMTWNSTVESNMADGQRLHYRLATLTAEAGRSSSTAVHKVTIPVDMRGRTLPAMIGANMDGDNQVTANDALILYYSLALGDLIGIGPTRDGHVHFRQSFLGGLVAGSLLAPTHTATTVPDALLRALIVRSWEWADPVVLPAATSNAQPGTPSAAVDHDINRDGRIDGDDALILYYSIEYLDLVGDGGRIPGTAEFRRELLQDLVAENIPYPDENDYQMLLTNAGTLWR